MEDFESKYTGAQVDALLDIVSQGGSGGGEVQKTTEAEILAMGFTKNEGTITGVKMNGVSKGTSGVVDLGNVVTDVSGKQDEITDLDAIRAGAAKGATALQLYKTSFSVEDIYIAKYENVDIDNAHKEDIVQAIRDGKKIATYASEIEGFYLADATLEGNELVVTYPALNIIIDTFITDPRIYSEDIIINIYVNEKDLSPVATTGSYKDLSDKPIIPAEQVNADWNATSGKAQILNKPTIPSAVTESTVSGWGFTKNAGTYSKPSGGIPKTDLASAVQTSLGKADTAVQPDAISEFVTAEDLAGVATSGSYNDLTNQPFIPNADSVMTWGFVKGVKLNGSTKTPSVSDGIVDLGTIEGGGGVSQEAFDSLVDTVDNLDADVAQLTKLTDSKQDTLVSGGNIKTINGQSLLGAGNVTISGGGGLANYPIEWPFVDGVVELVPNTYYMVEPQLGQSEIAFSLAAPTDDMIVNEYVVQIDNKYMIEDVMISFPSSITWKDGDIPTLKAGKILVISIVDTLAVYAEF